MAKVLTIALLEQYLKIQNPIAISEPHKITPEVAGYILSNYNVSNYRKFTPGTANSYARQMAEGKWHLNGDTISFLSNKILSDGQHRLHACVESKTPFTTFLVFGLEGTCVSTIDTGKNRTAKDSISNLVQVPSYSNNISSIVKQAMYFLEGKITEHGSASTRASAASNEEVVNFYSSNKDLIDKFYTEEVINWNKDLKNVKFLPSGRYAGFCLFLILRGSDYDNVVNFMNLLIHNSNNDLFKSARIRLGNEKNKLELNYHILVRAWNNYRNGNVDCRIKVEYCPDNGKVKRIEPCV